MIGSRTVTGGNPPAAGPHRKAGPLAQSRLTLSPTFNTLSGTIGVLTSTLMSHQWTEFQTGIPASSITTVAGCSTQRHPSPRAVPTTSVHPNKLPVAPNNLTTSFVSNTITPALKFSDLREPHAPVRNHHVRQYRLAPAHARSPNALVRRLTTDASCLRSNPS